MLNAIKEAAKKYWPVMAILLVLHWAIEGIVVNIMWFKLLSPVAKAAAASFA